MEYLITYGWAILIISLALVVLFELGIFNPNANAPKATPGQCSVTRPNGAGTTQFIALSGLCNNEMPEYVALFDGASSYASTSSNVVASNPLTIMAWFYLYSTSSNSVILTNSNSGLTTNGMRLYYSGSANTVKFEDGDGAGGEAFTSTTALKLNRWYQVAVVVNGANSLFYINGAAAGTFSATKNFNTNNKIYIGSYADLNNYFNGYISNVQLYNSAISANDINYVYLEGVGGIPLNIVNLVGWWPLNGDVTDYSGNNYFGTSNNIISATDWYNTYTHP